jgi:hypothetical protein
MTQVGIDKIVVHQTMSTLRVFGAAPVVFMLFTSGMIRLRQYLVPHTGNPIDASPIHATAPTQAERSYQGVPPDQENLFCRGMVVRPRLFKCLLLRPRLL